MRNHYLVGYHRPLAVSLSHCRMAHCIPPSRTTGNLRCLCRASLLWAIVLRGNHFVGRLRREFARPCHTSCCKLPTSQDSNYNVCRSCKVCFLQVWCPTAGLQRKLHHAHLLPCLYNLQISASCPHRNHSSTRSKQMSAIHILCNLRMAAQ